MTPDTGPGDTPSDAVLDDATLITSVYTNEEARLFVKNGRTGAVQTGAT